MNTHEEDGLRNKIADFAYLLGATCSSNGWELNKAEEMIYKFVNTLCPFADGEPDIHKLAGIVFDLSRDYMTHQCDSFQQTIAWIERALLNHDNALRSSFRKKK